MALMKSSLADALAQVFESKPEAPEAALQWAQAYLSYAQAAQSSVGTVPVTAPAGLGTLVGAFSSGLAALNAQAAGLAIAGGVMTFWQTMVWVGPGFLGATAVPGNFALAPTLAAVFADLGGAGPQEKADQLADAFDSGAKTVMVADVPLAPPPTPVVGPIQ